MGAYAVGLEVMGGTFTHAFTRLFRIEFDGVTQEAQFHISADVTKIESAITNAPPELCREVEGGDVVNLRVVAFVTGDDGESRQIVAENAQLVGILSMDQISDIEDDCIREAERRRYR